MSVVATTPRPRARGLGVDVTGTLNLVGGLLKWLGLAFLFPLAVALGYGESPVPFLVSGVVTSGAGFALEWTTDGKERVGAREGYLAVALLWLLVATFGALPYLIAEPQLANPVDAVFESMSGFSTTGSSVLTDIEGLSRSIAMWRQFTQWVGGLGIIVLFLAVLPRLRVGGRQALFKSEMPGPDVGLEETIRETSRRFLVLYLALTAVVFVALAGIGLTGVDDRMNLFRAVAHAFTTVATAGFSTEARSIEPFAPVTQWAIAFFMMLAGTNFALLYVGLVRRKPWAFARDEEFRLYLLLLALAAAVIVLDLSLEDRGEPTGEVRHAVFNTISMMTTTGFVTADFNEWTELSRVVLFALVLVGASAGSTSGSIKLFRHVVIGKMLKREIEQSVHPELVAPVHLNGRVIDDRAVRAIIVFVLLWFGVLVVGAIVILLDTTSREVPLSAFEAAAASAAALGGSGPALGFAGPMGSFEPFSDVSTVILAALMYLGRLELIPVLVLFTRSYWRA